MFAWGGLNALGAVDPGRTRAFSDMDRAAADDRAARGASA